MWNASQKREFAKQIIEGDFNRGSAVKYLTAPLRVALVEAFCFTIVRGQYMKAVEVEAMDDLVAGVKAAIEAKLGVGFFEP